MERDYTTPTATLDYGFQFFFNQDFGHDVVVFYDHGDREGLSFNSFLIKILVMHLFPDGLRWNGVIILSILF